MDVTQRVVNSAGSQVLTGWNMIWLFDMIVFCYDVVDWFTSSQGTEPPNCSLGYRLYLHVCLQALCVCVYISGLFEVTKVTLFYWL